MSKSNKYTDNELKAIQRYKYENDKLKRQIKNLRKQLDRIDIDRYQNLKELVEQQYKEDQDEHELNKIDEFKHKWKCHKCQEDYLRIVIVTRRDGDFYFRRCNNCGKKTKLKRYDENVEKMEQE